MERIGRFSYISFMLSTTVLLVMSLVFMLRYIEIEAQKNDCQKLAQGMSVFSSEIITQYSDFTDLAHAYATRDIGLLDYQRGVGIKIDQLATSSGDILDQLDQYEEGCYEQ